MDASSASCWIVKLDLPNLFKPLSRPLTRCCVATAVLLDGYRHTVGWLPPHSCMATATRLDGYRHTLWLTDDKILTIELSEKQISGRTISLKVKYSDVLSADAFSRSLK